MSNVSGMSSGSSSRGRFISGIPKRCWCGSSVISLMSNSGRNPHRRYYRCSYAVIDKLVDDDHVFKWVDEAIVNEIERIDRKMAEMESKGLEQQQILVEQLQVKIENELVERVDTVIAESECKMKKIVATALILGGIVTIGVMKLLE